MHARSRYLRPVVLTLSCFFAACAGEAAGEPDGGLEDASEVDGGALDGAAVDGAREDGASADAERARAFGEACARGAECESGLCVQTAAGRGVCTRECTDESMCPTVQDWRCTELRGLPTRGCVCDASGTSEVCDNGRDDDCNGLVDDCRVCGGRRVPDNDRAHCGACGNACRSDQVCSGGVCGCAPNQTLCNGTCTDTRTSRQHCGACGNTCASGQECAGGACRCASPSEALCGAACVDLRSAREHCGRCGNACSGDALCVDGACACRPGATYCEGVGCVDVRSDPAHCGGCGNACLVGESCSFGACSCRGNRCGNACVPYSESSCERCGAACAPSQACMGGRCTCASGQTLCTSACVDLRTDAANCGVCGRGCGAGQFCNGGICACGGGLSVCGDGLCHDTLVEARHCGACGNACPAGQSCVSGRCACPPATPNYCAAVSSCVSTTTDPNHCGFCGNVCPRATICQSGQCRCTDPNERYCPSIDGCVNHLTNNAHCGRCNNACGVGSTCQSGICICPQAGQTACALGCADLQSDRANCGQCGLACAGRLVCTGGRCACPPPSLSAEQRLSTTLTEAEQVEIVRLAAGWAVLFTEPLSPTTRDVFLVTLDDGGVPTGPARNITNHASGTLAANVHATWTGSELGVAFLRTRLGVAEVVVARFDASGAVLASPAVFAGPSTSIVSVDLAWTAAAGYVVAWDDSSGAWVRLLGPMAGQPMLPVRVHSESFGATSFALAVGAGGALGLLRASSSSARFVRVNADGSVTSPAVTLGPGLSDLAFDGVTWVAVVTAGGTVTLLRGDTLQVSRTVTTGGASEFVYGGQVATTASSDVVVTWVLRTAPGSGQPGVLRAARLDVPAAPASPPALVADPTTIVTATSVRPLPAPALAPSGAAGSYGVAWLDTRWGQLEVYARAVVSAACP